MFYVGFGKVKYFSGSDQSFFVFLPSTLLIPEVLFLGLFFIFMLFFFLFHHPLYLSGLELLSNVCCDSNSRVGGGRGRIAFCEQI